MERVCERCAGEDDDLVLVLPSGAPTEARSPGGELWCFDCRSEAVHVEVDDQR